MPDRVEALRACPVLEGFTEVGLKILAAVTRERVYLNAQTLQVQGEPPRDAGVLFLVRGHVRCEVRGPEGQVLGLGTLQPGDHLGGLRLFSEALSALTVTAEGEVDALALDRTAFERLRRQKPQTAMKLLFALSADFGRRLGENQAQFAEFAVFAATRANLQNQPSYPSYAALGLDTTPTLRP